LFSLSANAAFREIQCGVKFEGKIVDKSLIYVNPGLPTTTRLSINNGAAELFVVITHKPIGPSQINVYSENPAAPKSPMAVSKTQQQVRMADLKTTFVSIPIVLVKLGNKQAEVECSGMK
jgi:hypothetical protein